MVTCEEGTKRMQENKITTKTYYREIEGLLSCKFHLIFKNNNKWDREKKSLFIDTILRRIPVHSFFLETDLNGESNSEGFGGLHVRDGNNRLQTILDYINNKFPLDDNRLHILFGGSYFKDLPPVYQRIINNCNLTFHEITPASKDDDLIFIFKRFKF